MRAEIKDNRFIAMSRHGAMTYEVTNWSDMFNMNDILTFDENLNYKIIPQNIDEVNKTCEVIINPLYIYDNE
jgi:hypothetical protein